MPVVDTRVGPGTLTFGAAPLDFSCQVASAALVPDNAEDDVTPTLCDPKPVAPVTTTWTGTLTVKERMPRSTSSGTPTSAATGSG